MPRPTAADLERVEIDAYADLAASGPRRDEAPTLSVRRFGAAAVVCVPGTANVVLNRVVGLGVGTEARATDVDAILDHAAVVTRRFAVSLTPDARPGRLLEGLLARGFVAGYPWMKLHRSAAAPCPATDTRLPVRELVDATDVSSLRALVSTVWGEAFGAVLGPALSPGRSGSRWFVAVDGARVVGAGALFARGGLGWLGWGATDPGYRHRGVHRALVAARVHAARAAGVKTLAVETGVRRPGMPEASYRNLRWAGFEEAYVRANLWSPAIARTALDGHPLQ